MNYNTGALLKISQALYGLVGSLVKTLEECGDAVHSLELERAAGIINGRHDEPQTSLSVAVGPELLVVAGTLKQMVGTWVLDMKANAEVQKLLPAIQKISGANHDVFFEDVMISKQPSCKLDSRTAKVAVKGEVICRHACEHHPELVDPWLWRRSPQELVELIFARLPLPCVIELWESSRLGLHWRNPPISERFAQKVIPNSLGLSGQR